MKRLPLSLRLALCLLLIFAAGAYAGSTFTRTQDKRWLHQQIAQLKSVEDSWLQRLHDRYAADLGMTPEQIDQVRPAMDRARADFKNVRTEAAQRARRIMGDLYQAVHQTLTPEQQATFQRLVKERVGFQNAMAPHGL